MIRLVIVTEEMQGTVHQHMTPVVAERLALLACFMRHDAGANDDITQQRPLPGRREPGVACRECEHVRRLVPPPVIAIQDVEAIEEYTDEEMAMMTENIFRTNDMDHPGVKATVAQLMPP